MKRTKFGKATAILTSDWHIRESIPECRTDNFMQAQWDKLLLINELYYSNGRIPILHAGDVFHHWKPSPYLLSNVVANLPFYDDSKEYGVIAIAGQHDLPQHNLELMYKSGIETLFSAGTMTKASGGHFGSDKPHVIELVDSEMVVGLWHKLIWEKRPPHWDKDGLTAKEVLEEFSEFDLIVTGDNHASFVVKHEGRLLVNPGCLTRQKASEANHKPKVYLWFEESNTVEPFLFPIGKKDVSREHIERREQRDARIEAFVERLSEEIEVGLDFKENIEMFIQKHNVKEQIKNIIYEALEVEIK